MNKKTNIAINHPCKEDWNQFEKKEGSGYCQSCQHTVIDFTKMTSHEIQDHLKNSTGQVCGRFKKSQLGPIGSNHQQRATTPAFYKVAAATALLVLTNLESRGQDAIGEHVTESPVSGSSTSQYLPQQKSDPITVKGTVSSTESGSSESLPGVTVVLKGTDQGTYTDLDGNFEFPHQLNQGDVLVFSFIGFESFEYMVTNDRDEASIQMVEAEFKECHMIFMGKVDTHELYHEKTGIKKAVDKLFRR